MYRKKARSIIAAVVAAGVMAAGLVATPLVASAVGPSDRAVVNIPDRSLKALLNQQLAEITSMGRHANQSITYGQMRDVRKLHIFGKNVKIRSLKGLEAATNLRELGLKDQPYLTDLSPLKRLSLKQLSINNAPALTNLSPVAYLNKLYYIDLSNMPKVTSLFPLAYLENLTQVRLDNLPKVRDLAAFQYQNDIDIATLSNLPGIRDYNVFAAYPRAEVNITETTGKAVDFRAYRYHRENVKVNYKIPAPDGRFKLPKVYGPYGRVALRANSESTVNNGAGVWLPRPTAVNDGGGWMHLAFADEVRSVNDRRAVSQDLLEGTSGRLHVSVSPQYTRTDGGDVDGNEGDSNNGSNQPTTRPEKCEPSWASSEKGKKFYTENCQWAANGTYTVDGKTYLFDRDGYVYRGWSKVDGAWRYFGEGGVMATGWKKIGGSWYYFDSKGASVTGWANAGSTKYYFDSEGRMVTGWQRIDNSVYYFNNDGTMRTDQLREDNAIYRFASDGRLDTGWMKYRGVWYSLALDGDMQFHWVEAR